MAVVYHLRVLTDQFCKRKAANSHYSLRAYARDLGLNPSTLSRILSHKRGIPLNQVQSLSQRLGLSPKQREAFLNSILRTRGVVLKSRSNAVERATLLRGDSHFRIIAEWECFAILNLMKLPDFRSDPTWIASRLGIPRLRCERFIEDLFQAGLVGRDSSGQWTRTESRLETSDDISSLALKLAHRNELRLAVARQEEIPLPLRDFCSMTFPADPSRLTQAKKLTREYLTELTRLLESGKPTEVYQLSVQLFPVTNPIRNKPRGRK